jgi:hypothetical protein
MKTGLAHQSFLYLLYELAKLPANERTHAHHTRLAYQIWDLTLLRAAPCLPQLPRGHSGEGLARAGKLPLHSAQAPYSMQRGGMFE